MVSLRVSAMQCRFDAHISVQLEIGTVSSIVPEYPIRALNPNPDTGPETAKHGSAPHSNAHYLHPKAMACDDDERVYMHWGSHSNRVMISSRYACSQNPI